MSPVRRARPGMPATVTGTAVSSLGRKITRQRAKAILLAQARAGGCTCNPTITVPSSLAPGKVRVATIAHDRDCPHRRTGGMSRELVARINLGEWDVS